jgi:hypothetical protein
LFPQTFHATERKEPNGKSATERAELKERNGKSATERAEGGSFSFLLG